MKPNRPGAKHNPEKFVRTSERIPFFSYRPVCMTLLQPGSIEKVQLVFMQHGRQHQCHPILKQITKKKESFQVNNAVR
jgi:hypothetical protein